MLAKRFFYMCGGAVLLALSFHLGATSAPAQSGAQEVAVLSGIANDGETIPLPTYRDGSDALESECRWMVSPTDLTSPTSGFDGFVERCSTEGRTVHEYWCSQDNCEVVGCCRYPGSANYLIIAVRGSLPTAAKEASFGSVKARYRK